MIRTLYPYSCLVAVVAVAVQIHGSIAFGAINVAVVAEDGGMSSAVQLAAQLNDDTFFDFTATVVTTSGADSAAELSPFGVVVLGGSGHTSNWVFRGVSGRDSDIPGQRWRCRHHWLLQFQRPFLYGTTSS